MAYLNPDLVAELKKHLRGEIRSDLATKTLYSTDASIYQIEPLGVAFPKTQDDLHAAVELAAKYKIPILPRGAGSSIAGQAIGQALILDTSRWLNQLVELDPEARTAIVEPGLVLAKLNAAAAKYGLTFGPDPASAERATLGGVIGNNATGAHSILYGMAADHIISADVVLADGSLEKFDNSATDISILNSNGRIANIVSTVRNIREKYATAIWQNYPHTWRNSAGYRLNYLLPWSPSAPPRWIGDAYPANLQPDTFNLAHLLAGSEGTLAVIRRATVNLVQKPKNTILGVLSYNSIAEACDDVPRLLEFSPSAVELVPQMLIRLAKGVPAYASQLGWVNGDPAALLIVEFSGDRPEALKEAVSKLGPGVIVAESLEDQTHVWTVRKVGLGIFDSRPADARPVAFIEDCAIPVARLGEFVREIDKILSAYGTYAAFYAHASAGCLHIRPILNLKDVDGRRALRSIAEATFALTLRLGGAMSSEHGDGIARAEFLRQTYGAEVVDAMRLLKQAADPENLLNPGKLLEAPPMDTHLRFGEAYQPRPWSSVLDFSRNNGLAGAIEQCNGQGVCRKDGGVMCPSFQATREEKNSTRGRANLLRAFINNQQLAFGFHQPDAEMRKSEIEDAAYGALDLCLACKGCKSECPSGVDMAKLKYDFQHEYYRSHRRKLRDYLFAYIGPLAKLGAPFGKLVNWGMRRQIVRLMANPLLGLSKERELPSFAPQHHKPNSQISTTEYCESVILLRDTFTHFFEPEIEQSVLFVLSACGTEVKILPYFGAGRTLISKGFLEPAKRHAERILDAIRKLDPKGEFPVLGIEPSELYTLRDEFLDLLPERRTEAEALAARAWLVDEFLIRPDDNGETRSLRITKMLLGETTQKSLITESKSRIFLHGHCYQKAQPPATDGFPVGQAASAELLRALGFNVGIIPSGCCGMAGAFGYEAEHYEVSMQVGELVLFPFIRDRAAQDVQVSAVGTSCRAQILDGTGVQAKHPLVVVANHLCAVNKINS